MTLTLRKKAREAEILIDLELYSEEAIKLAAPVFSAKAEFFVDEDPSGRLKIVLQAKKGVPFQDLRRIAGEFLNEALNQDLRLGLLQRNSRILQLLTAQALAAAKAPEQGPDDAGVEKSLASEAERLMTEERRLP